MEGNNTNLKNINKIIKVGDSYGHEEAIIWGPAFSSTIY